MSRSESSVPEFVSLPAPIDKLKKRIRELSLFGGKSPIPVGVKWGQKDLANGFKITNMAMFFPKKTREKNKITDRDDSIEHDSEKDILFREIHSVELDDSDSRAVFSYLIRFAEGNSPVIMITNKDLAIINAFQTVHVQLPQIEACLAALINKNELLFINKNTLQLTQDSEESREFVEKLIEDLRADNLELVQD